MTAVTTSQEYGELARASVLRIWWACGLGVSLALSVLAAFHGGYIGPDYYTHFTRLVGQSPIFDFAATSPPIYYLLGRGLFLLLGNAGAFPILLSIVQATTNTVALWWFFVYTERRFSSRLIHLGLALFLAFLPVRIIHASTIGTDSTTIPLFVLLLFLFDRLLCDKNFPLKGASFVGLGLALAVWTKYSFMALIPATFLLVAWLGAVRRWKLEQFLAICALSLILPSALALHSFWASSRVHGYNTEKHWLAKDEAPDMDYGDLFSIKAKDIELFRAPEYFRSKIRAPHRHSYLGLVHFGVFTDSMNLFQLPPADKDLRDVWVPDNKTRRPWKTSLMEASMILGMLWTTLVLISVPWSLVCAFRALLGEGLEREDVVAILGTAFFLLMFLPIPFVSCGALFGYWTPRLILPSLLFFSLAAFLFIDRKIALQSKPIAGAFLILVLLQCLIEAGMLA
jgi:4-amino-4-deoxy-L-arabinose transferase-like glycosyltransferase